MHDMSHILVRDAASSTTAMAALLAAFLKRLTAFADSEAPFAALSEAFKSCMALFLPPKHKAVSLAEFYRELPRTLHHAQSPLRQQWETACLLCSIVSAAFCPGKCKLAAAEKVEAWMIPGGWVLTHALGVLPQLLLSAAQLVCSARGLGSEKLGCRCRRRLCEGITYTPAWHADLLQAVAKGRPCCGYILQAPGGLAQPHRRVLLAAVKKDRRAEMIVLNSSQSNKHRDHDCKVLAAWGHVQRDDPAAPPPLVCGTIIKDVPQPPTVRMGLVRAAPDALAALTAAACAWVRGSGDMRNGQSDYWQCPDVAGKRTGGFIEDTFCLWKLEVPAQAAQSLGYRMSKAKPRGFLVYAALEGGSRPPLSSSESSLASSDSEESSEPEEL